VQNTLFTGEISPSAPDTHHFAEKGKISMTMLEKRPHIIPCIIAAVMLLLALAPWPYGYYQLLRFVACGVAVYVVVMAYNWHETWAIYLFGFIAVLFNPLIPIHLSRELWQLIDTICAFAFVVIMFILQKPLEGKNG
jgi:hypothetical protein